VQEQAGKAMMNAKEYCINCLRHPFRKLPTAIIAESLQIGYCVFSIIYYNEIIHVVVSRHITLIQYSDDIEAALLAVKLMAFLLFHFFGVFYTNLAIHY
jgi:hypothetical protein